jgi:hypothetical protein
MAMARVSSFVESSSSVSFDYAIAYSAARGARRAATCLLAVDPAGLGAVDLPTAGNICGL